MRGETCMAQSEVIRAKARQLQGQPVRVTLHNGETYIGYIANCYDRGVVLAGVASPVPSSRGQRACYPNPKKGKTRKQAGSRSRGSSASRLPQSSKSLNSPKSIKSSKATNFSKSPNSLRTRKKEAQVSALFPMLGSLLGGFGGLSGGLKLFGMIQRVFPVIKMGYGMIKSISPFVGAVKGLMAPATVEATDAD